MSPNRLGSFTVAAVLAMASGFAAAAPCALSASTSGPPRQILVCPGGVRIEAEEAATVRVEDPGDTGQPGVARVDGGAVLVTVPKAYPGGFQIRTPRAVASVRGTTWAVDAMPAQTSVFVLDGAVDVRRASASAIVTLRPGDGTDVRDDASALTVKQWAKPRAAALLARFGR